MTAVTVRPRDFATPRRDGETQEDYQARWDREEGEYRGKFRDDFGRLAEAFVRALADKGDRKP